MTQATPRSTIDLASGASLTHFVGGEPTRPTSDDISLPFRECCWRTMAERIMDKTQPTDLIRRLCILGTHQVAFEPSYLGLDAQSMASPGDLKEEVDWRREEIRPHPKMFSITCYLYMCRWGTRRCRSRAFDRGRPSLPRHSVDLPACALTVSRLGWIHIGQTCTIIDPFDTQC